MKATVVVNAHREGALLVPSLRSIIEARNVADARGHDIELLLILDSPDTNTRRIVEEFAPQMSCVYEVAYRDLGASRQFGIHRANTEYAFLHDGDDLYSRNWYAQFLDGLETGEFDPEAIHHTALFVGFGRDLYFRQTMASNNPLFDPLYMCSEWYFSNKCVVPVNSFKRFPFPKNDIRGGVGNEDWSWSGDTIDAGLTHAVVPETICFYRHKAAEDSLGLVPGMIHHRSSLYAPSHVHAEQERRRARPMGASPVGDGVLIARDYPSEIPTPRWVWDEVWRQSKFEPLLTDLYALPDKQKHIRPVNLHKNVAGAWREICQGLEDGPKVLTFFSADAVPGADLFLEKAISDIRRSRSSNEQIIVVLEGKGFIVDEEYFLRRYRAKIVSVSRLADTLKLEDWYLCRFLMRILIQFDSTVLIDFGSRIFARIFREFHRSICSRHSDIRFLYALPHVDLYSEAFQALKSSLSHYHTYTGKPGLLISFAQEADHLAQLPNVEIHQFDAAGAQAWWYLLALRYLSDQARRMILLSTIDFRPMFAERRPLPNVTPYKRSPETRGHMLLLVSTGGSWHAPALRSTAADLLSWIPNVDALVPQVVCYTGLSGRHKALWLDYNQIRANIASYLETCLIERGDLPFFAYLRPGSPVQEAVTAWMNDSKPITTPTLVQLLLDHTSNVGVHPIEASLCVAVTQCSLKVEDLMEIF